MLEFGLRICGILHNTMLMIVDSALYINGTRAECPSDLSDQVEVAKERGGWFGFDLNFGFFWVED